MDRLRSPGGCPWDAEQTHTSLMPYLLEEAYEAYEALESGDTDALREELGDVLLQVVFHARLAEELPEGRRWSVDDVAAGLVEKLTRRHPHVFADRAVSGVDEVTANWESLKAEERAASGRNSVTEGVPMGQPALALAAKLQSRAARAGLPPALVSPLVAGARSPASAVAEGAAEVADDETGGEAVERVGELLFAAVALARSAGVDPEAALRGTARRFRDRLAAAEAVLRAGGDDAADAAAWERAWATADTGPDAAGAGAHGPADEPPAPGHDDPDAPLG